MTQGKSRVFSGIQPSGELHIGNYLGAIKNWVALTETYDCIYCIVDLHAVTIPYEPAQLQDRIRELAIGVLASGLHPERCTLFDAAG
jgi:tryptophanyl-tRNA synthetase